MEQHHLLVVTFPAQGHINPAHHLALRLARITGARVTFSTTISAHRRMFPSSVPDQEDTLINYAPYSDGYDDGFDPNTQSTQLFMSTSKILGSQSLSRLAGDLAASGRPITHLIYTILLSWAADVARDLSIPAALFWIQPATVFTIYHRFFHGYADLISSHKDDPSFIVHIPGLDQPLRIRDLPDLVTLSSTALDFYTSILSSLQDLFYTLDRLVAEPKSTKPVVLVNTFDALEPAALSAVDELELVAVGPMMDTAITNGDLFKLDSREYMEWLDSKEAKSVVYVAFGSFTVMSKQQVGEIQRGLEESGRRYLWVMRDGKEAEEIEGGEMGMVVGWCSQTKVLNHPSVGCFVTHCGWNSMSESIACGAPMLMVPKWSDQATNARMAEEWGVGVRCEVNEEGVLEGRELRRCVDLVMGEEGVEIRRRAAMWRDKAVEAMGEEGSSLKNLKTCVERFGEAVPKE